MPGSRINLFQYWDTGSPPQEVQRLMETWRSDGDFVHRCYDERSAQDYIAQHSSERILAAFRLCAFGAMQSDIFRYVALLAEGGIWMDADQGNNGRLARFVEAAPKGMLHTFPGGMANGFIFVRRPGSPLIKQVLRTAIKNIEQRISNNVAEVTGPGILDAIYQRKATRPLFDGWLIEDLSSMLRYIHYVMELPYKTTEADWRASAFGGTKSIFRDVPDIGQESVTPSTQKAPDGPREANARLNANDPVRLRRAVQKRDLKIASLNDEIARLVNSKAEEAERMRARHKVASDLQDAIIANLRTELDSYSTSTSWRMTSPLRAIAERTRRLRS